jgi:MoaA/NifB/PqqE/SkfB family radical SAM enzyme
MSGKASNTQDESSHARVLCSRASAERRSSSHEVSGALPGRRYDWVVVCRVTQQCNLSCPFCGYDRRLDWPRRQADPARLLRFGAVLAEYQRATGSQVLVSWIGGEPLLWPPLAQFTSHFSRACGLHVSTTTNGTTLGSPAVRGHVLAHYAELTVSVDGIGTVHDHLRGWLGGFAALRKNVSALASEKRAAGGGPRLRANVVLMRDTVGDFAALCLELADWGIEAITFNQLGGNDRPEFHPANRLLPEQVDRLAEDIPFLRRRLAKHGVRLSGGEGYLRRLQASARGERIPVADCDPGRRFLFINEQGRAAPCSLAACECGVPLEQIGSVEELLGLPRRFQQSLRCRRPAACADCHCTQVFEKFTEPPLASCRSRRESAQTSWKSERMHVGRCELARTPTL